MNTFIAVVFIVIGIVMIMYAVFSEFVTIGECSKSTWRTCFLGFILIFAGLSQFSGTVAIISSCLVGATIGVYLGNRFCNWIGPIIKKALHEAVLHNICKRK